MLGPCQLEEGREGAGAWACGEAELEKYQQLAGCQPVPGSARLLPQLRLRGDVRAVDAPNLLSGKVQLSAWNCARPCDHKGAWSGEPQ